MRRLNAECRHHHDFRPFDFCRIPIAGHHARRRDVIEDDDKGSVVRGFGSAITPVFVGMKYADAIEIVRPGQTPVFRVLPSTAGPKETAPKRGQFAGIFSKTADVRIWRVGTKYSAQEVFVCQGLCGGRVDCIFCHRANLVFVVHPRPIKIRRPAHSGRRFSFDP